MVLREKSTINFSFLSTDLTETRTLSPCKGVSIGSLFLQILSASQSIYQLSAALNQFQP